MQDGKSVACANKIARMETQCELSLSKIRVHKQLSGLSPPERRDMTSPRGQQRNPPDAILDGEATGDGTGEDNQELRGLIRRVLVLHCRAKVSCANCHEFTSDCLRHWGLGGTLDGTWISSEMIQYTKTENGNPRPHAPQSRPHPPQPRLTHHSPAPRPLPYVPQPPAALITSPTTCTTAPTTKGRKVLYVAAQKR